MSVPPSGSRFKYLDRPDPCRTCGALAWWNGVRRVAQVVRDVVGAIRYAADIVRRRARCSDRDCTGGSWTVYGEGAYPHRTFQLPVVASAVATMSFERDATLTAVAAVHQCSRRSVARWSPWVARLAEPATLRRACARVDPDGLPPPPAAASSAEAPPAARAGVVLRLLDRLADLLRQRGVRLPAAGCALAAILGHQLARFGDVAYLTRASPPLRVEPAALLV